MEIGLKQRLIGALVLVSAAVIFIPMLLDGMNDAPSGETVIEDVQPDSQAGFSSAIVPLDKPTKIRPEEGSGVAAEDERFANMPLVGKKHHNGDTKVKPLAPVKPEKTPTEKSPGKKEVKTSQVAKAPATSDSKPETTKSAPKQSPQQAKQPEASSKTTQVTTKSSKTEDKPSKIEDKPKETVAKTTTTAKPGNKISKGWVVQVGSFATQHNANTLRDQLIKSGFPAFVEKTRSDDGQMYRVRLGPNAKREEAEAVQTKLQESTFLTGIVMAYP